MFSWSGRPKRNTPEVNYKEDSDSEEDFNSPLNSPPPVNTRQGSPVLLAIPQLNDNVDEDLEQVSQTLQNIGHTPLFRKKQPKDLPESNLGTGEEVIDELFVAGEGLGDLGIMPDEVDAAVVIDFEDENWERRRQSYWI